MTTVSADPGIIYVNNATGNDSWDGQSATYTSGLNGPKLSIKNATGVVTSNGVVNIASGTYNEYNIAITLNMTLIGHTQDDTIINAEQQGRIFTINSGVSVTLENLTLKNANPTGYGGAINNDGGTVTIINSTLNNNAVPGNYGLGGAIYNNGGTVTITSSTLNNNTANEGGAIYNNRGTVNITSSTLNNNGGGAICNDRGILTITSSTLNKNNANCGGAVDNSGGTVNITSSTLNNNTANYAAAIMNSGFSGPANLTLNFCSIVDNSNNLPVIYNSIYSSGGSADLNNNWWGTNTPDFSILIAWDFYPSSWVILSVNATPSTINNNGTSTITADFNHVNGGGDLTGGHIPDGPITLEILWGSLNTSGQHLISLNTVNGSIDHVTFYANEGAIDPLFNPVRVNATADGYTTNDTESAYIYINPVANLTISKIGPTVATAGTQITYTITIINEGIDPAEGVSLSDTMTNTNIFNTGTLQYRYKTNDDDWNSWTSFTNPLNLNLGTIINGKNATIKIRGTINASTTSGSIINNTATTSTTTTSGDKTASIQTIIDTQADLNVTKTGPESIIAGNQITYTITVKNKGPSDAKNVVIVDIIPAILQNVSLDSFNLGTIPAGESRTIYINGTIPSSTAKGTLFQNMATVTSDTTGTITPSLLVTTTVDTLADVDLNKTVNNTRPDVGDTVTFIVTAHNYGPSDATNIQIQDIMPAEFTNVNITPSQGTYDIGRGTWTLDLISGEEATLNMTGIVSALMAGKNITNNATKISQTQEDPDTLDTANATIYVPKADLYIQITSDKNNPTVGQLFTLRYKLGNNGPDDALNVTITIPIPDGFVISKIEGDGTWTIVGNNLIWTMNNVTVGDPDLYVSGWTIRPGNYLFSASIASNTFSTNSRGVSSLSLNAQPQINAVTATKTIGMQKTGAPIAGIVLAILMVFGGFISTRKRQ